MVWEAQWDDWLAGYLTSFAKLIGDRRTGVTLAETIRGIISAGSLVCERIAAHSPVLQGVKDGAQRVSRMATGESTKRSEIDAERLTERLRERGLDDLGQADTDELWLILDLSELRKPHAEVMPDLMQVKDLDGSLVPGYRTVNVLGVTPKHRGILYHRLFSSRSEEFVSQPQEIQAALETVHTAIQARARWQAVTWIMDSEMDDVAVWRTIWEQDAHLVVRAKHLDRLIEYQDENGHWQSGHLSEAQPAGDWLAQVQSEMVVTRGRQVRPKAQMVTAEIRSRPIRVRYESQVRREGARAQTQVHEHALWLVEVRLLGTHMTPWLLLTDWPVTASESALRIFRMYRQRWAVEDAFKFTKQTLGWEEVQLLDLTGIRTLVALAWVAAGFLYELGVTLEWPEVHLLARLGGWVERKNRKPGKTLLTRGLHRLLDMLTTEAFLAAYIREHGALPPRIAALLRGWSPPQHL
jgi:hypothetical protein